MENNHKEINLIPPSQDTKNEVKSEVQANGLSEDLNENKKEENSFISSPKTTSEKVIDTTINNKLFTKGDIFVYLGIIVLVLGLFFAFIFPTFFANEKHTGFKIYKNNDIVLEFNIESENLFTVNEKYSSLVEIKGNDKLKHCFDITVYISNEKQGFNVIQIDTVNLTAKVTESTCSTSKDCVYTPKIEKSGSIYCAPHHLKIVPNNYDGFIPPIAG